MQLTVRHRTVYRYAQQPLRSTQYIRLSPCASARQKSLRWQLDLPDRAVTLYDAFDNLTHVLTLAAAPQEISLVASGTVEVADSDDGEPAGSINPMVFLRETPLTASDAAIRSFVEPMRHGVAQRPLVGISDLMAAVNEKMPYRQGSTAADCPATQSFALGAGVCQDHAHVFISCCRVLGVPARYVSGYLFLPGRPEVASHAWAEVWLSNRWVSFDISNTRHAGSGHVKLAIGRDYLDACPVRGMRLGGGDEQLFSAVSIELAACGQ